MPVEGAAIPDRQAVQTAGLRQCIEIVAAGPTQESRIGVEQVVATIDQHADRKFVEKRPGTASAGRCVCLVGDIRMRRAQFGRRIGIGRTRGKRFRFVDPLGELPR